MAFLGACSMLGVIKFGLLFGAGILSLHAASLWPLFGLAACLVLTPFCMFLSFTLLLND